MRKEKLLRSAPPNAMAFGGAKPLTSKQALSVAPQTINKLPRSKTIQG